jgi:glycine cleavage system H protein
MFQGFLFSKTHEWVRVETDPSGAKIGTVGISAFAVQTLTDLVFIELPQPGRQVTAGEPFGEIESVKAVSDLNSPVDGEVVEVNTSIVDHLDRLAIDPYEAGWLVKVKLSGDAGLAALMDYAAYQKQCEEETESH